MMKRSDGLQDLDQALSGELAGSTAGRNELRQSNVVHIASCVSGGRPCAFEARLLRALVSAYAKTRFRDCEAAIMPRRPVGINSRGGGLRDGW